MRGERGPVAPTGPSPSLLDQRGFSLVEAIVATVIAVIAVLGLAHSFGAGRSLINRYETARGALSIAQLQMETLSAARASSDSLDASKSPFGPFPIAINSKMNGSLKWLVTWVDDPFDGLAFGDQDYKRAVVMVIWTEGGVIDTVRLERNFLPQ